MYPRITGTCTQNECAETAMGRRGDIGAIQVRKTHLHQPTTPPHLIIGSRQRGGNYKTKTKTQGPPMEQRPPQGRCTDNKEPTTPDQATLRQDRVHLYSLDVDITDTH